MDFDACNKRDREVREVWSARMKADSNDRPCFDCASNYIYQWEPFTIAMIKPGRWAWDDGYDCLPICDEHIETRRKQK